MNNTIIRELNLEDKEAFLKAMQHSQSLHHPWVTPPLTSHEFDDYWQRFQQPNQKSYLACDDLGQIVGVFNISEMVRGAFQNAFIGFYGVKDYSGKGFMNAGLKLVQKKVFEELALHRLEANIQPENTRSIQLVKNNGFRYEGFSPLKSLCKFLCLIVMLLATNAYSQNPYSIPVFSDSQRLDKIQK